MTQLSLFDLPTTDLRAHFLWCLPRSGNRFVVGLPIADTYELTTWLKREGVQCIHTAACSGGYAALLAVPSHLIPLFRQLPSGAGGSRHVSNFLGF